MSMEEDALGTRAGSERWSVGEKGSEQLQRYRERRDGDLAWESLGDSSWQFCDGGGWAGASWSEEVQRWEHGCQ